MAKTAKKAQAIDADARAIAQLRADVAALLAAMDPKDRSKIWWNYFGLVSERARVARIRAALRKRLPLGPDVLAELLTATARIGCGEGGLARHDPTAVLLKHADRLLGDRAPDASLRVALLQTLKTLNAANAPVQRLRRQAEALVSRT